MVDFPVLNVALIENHQLRHTAIFKSFEQLEIGDSFIIRNDHDPLPVYYQLKAINGPIVGWEYLKKEPQAWDIKVTKTKEGEVNKDPLY